MSVAKATQSLQSEIASLVESFDVVTKINEIESSKEPLLVYCSLTLNAEAEVKLDDSSKFSESSSPPATLSSSTEKFTLTPGDELKYSVTAGDLSSSFKIVFEADKSKPKLKLGDELEDDKSPIGFRTTTKEVKTKIEIEKETEVEVEWTKGKLPEKKSKSEKEYEGSSGGYELKYEEESEYKQEKDKTETETEVETTIKHKETFIDWELY